MYTTQMTSSASRTSTTRGFMSFSSQSVIENSKGPSVMEKMKENLYFLAINMQRNTAFSTKWITFASIFRIIQNYAVILMPGCTGFWEKDSHASIFIHLLTLPIHFCFVPGNTTFHSIISIFFSLVLCTVALILFVFLKRDKLERSYTKNEMFLVSLMFALIVPIFTTFSLSSFGTLLKHAIFFKYKKAILYVGLIFGAISAVLIVPLNMLSFALIRARNSIDPSTAFATWASQTWKFFAAEIYLSVCAMLEEFLPLNRKEYMIAFCVILLLFNNPIMVYSILNTSIFQSHGYSLYFCVEMCNSMLCAILMISQFYVEGITPVIVFVATIIGFVVFLLLFRVILNLYENSVIKKLSSVYKYSKSILPPITPLIFSNPDSMNVGLTQEAYSVIQAFNSLDIKNSNEFHKYVSIGADAKLPSITNLDFIKWGISRFSDYNTLIDSSQACEFFGDTNQVLTVIVQHVKEQGEPSFFLSFVLNIIDSLHTDKISDKPQLLTMLEKKATAGLARCRRTAALFWGCVLNHSSLSMKDALCKMRDSIKETEAHFDELTRCYPYTKTTITHYISFLTEVKGYYMETESFINKVSANFIEARADEEVTEDESIDGVSEIIADKSYSFHMFLENLSDYMEQERLANGTSHAPMIALWTLACVSLLTIIVFIIYVIVETLSTFNTYPKLLDIVKTCTDVITRVGTLSISARRMCLFSKDMINIKKTVDFGNAVTHANVYDNASVLTPYFVENAETLPSLLQTFYKATSYSDEMLKTIEQIKDDFILYGNKFTGSLSFALDLMANSIRNVAGNVPMVFQDQVLKKPFSIDEEEDIHSQRDAYFNQFEQMTRERLKIPHPDNENHRFITFNINGKEKTYDPVELYATTCQSSCIKHLVKNIEPLNNLLMIFFDNFLGVGKDAVNGLEKILKITMIVLPIGFIVIFSIAVAITAYFVVRESNFRTTLYLSLPEQVASEIFRAGGLISKSYKKESKDKDSKETTEISGASKNVQFDESPEIDQMKSKAQKIESLHQFSSRISSFEETGIRHFIAWSIIYILYGALGTFVLTFYGSNVNAGFYARSVLICKSALRFLRLLYSNLLTSEYFFQDSTVKLLEPDDIHKLTELLLEGAIECNEVLTFGDDDTPYNFREYSGIKKLIIKSLGETRSNVTLNAERSYATLQHDGYKQFGFDSKIRIYTSFLKGVNENFKKNKDSFAINDPVWEHFEHVFFGHLISDAEETISVYLDGVSATIDQSLIIAAIISIALLLVLVIIFLWPLRNALDALEGYFDLTLHTICMIPKDVFARSIYIGKWLKGEITNANYHQYEANFKRTVSQSLQAKILKESSEKLLIFNINGEYIPIGEEQAPEKADLNSILEKYIDPVKNSRVFESVEKSFLKIQEAKDAVDSISIKATSTSGNPLKITVRGIPTSETDISNSANITKYYAFISIILKDITQEQAEIDSYKKQRDKTLSLISRCVPPNFAQRLHDGERRITFSSGIGSVENFEICDYEKVFADIDPVDIANFLIDIRGKIDELLVEFQNVSLISFTHGIATFVAGLFNDEQNGRTEAIDSLHFAVKLNDAMKEILAKYKIDATARCSIATGGPIFCKLLMDASPLIIISEDTTDISAAILKLAKPGQLLLERTTYECIYGINIDAQIVGDFDFNGKHTSLYAVSTSSLQLTQQPQQQ